MNIQLLPDLRDNTSDTGTGEHVVIVFDNSHNTVDEVERILRAATGCSAKEAEIETWEVHHLGRSVVHHGEPEECNRAAAVIRTIGIRVEVTQE